jgi:hypothetical protein
MVELLVVIMIIVLLATMMVPRLLHNDVRVFRATCDEVADLLTMFAQRDSITQQPVGLYYDEDAHRLMVQVYDIDPESMDRRAEWRRDRFIRPVQLPPFVQVLDVFEDQSPVDIRRWPLTSRPGQERPWIEVVLGGPDDMMRTIVLAPYEIAPYIYGDGEPPPSVATPINLNAAGRMREDW